MATSGDHHRGHAGSSNIGRGRDDQQASPPSGKFLSILFPPPSLRILLHMGGKVWNRKLEEPSPSRR